MSTQDDITQATTRLNEAATKANTTTDFFDNVLTGSETQSFTNPNNGKSAPSVKKATYDRTDELFSAAESDINQAVIDAQAAAGEAQVYAANAQYVEERTLGVGASLYEGTGVSAQGNYVQNGDTVPVGTTHLIVLINGKPEEVAMSPVANGSISGLTEYSATIGGSGVALIKNPNNEFHTPYDFGAVKGGLVDSTEQIINWLSSGKKLSLDDSYLFTSIDIEVSNIRLIGGGGELVSSTNVSGSPLLKITGGNNKLKGFNVRHTGNMMNFSNMVWLEGSKNRIEESDTSCDISYEPLEGEQYIKSGIVLVGDSNSALRNTGSDTGTGVIEDGRYNLVKGNEYKRICCGVKMQSKSRYAHILDNIIDCEYKGQGLQGCDGIWGERSHRFSVIRGNTIKNTGEHGGYLQGDGFTWDGSNILIGTYKCAFKAGAKPTGNFAYAGETLPTFTPEGAASNLAGSQYAVTGAKVFVRATGCNVGSSSDGTFCLQTNIADIDILGFDIRDCGDGSVNAIKSQYLESEAAENQHVMANIRIGNDGILRNSGNVLLACKAGLYVGKSDFGGASITTYAKTGETNQSPVIEALFADILNLTRVNGAIINGGTFTAINESNSTNSELRNVDITDQSQGGGWSGGRVKVINGGNISWLTDTAFNINGVSDCTNVTFNIPDYTGSYALQYNSGQGNPTEGSFNGNIVNAPLSNRPVRVGGNYSAVNSNTIIGAPTADYALTVQGEQVTVDGNAIRYGVVRFETTSNNCTTDHLNVSDAGINNFGPYKGVSGSFTTVDGKTVTVMNGLITSIAP